MTDGNPMTVFDDVMATILERERKIQRGFLYELPFDQGIDKILKKVGEEAAEIILLQPRIRIPMK